MLIFTVLYISQKQLYLIYRWIYTYRGFYSYCYLRIFYFYETKLMLSVSYLAVTSKILFTSIKVNFNKYYIFILILYTKQKL